MNKSTDLLRQLGFWDALTIGAGTMIGAGIFLLSGVALSLTGPAAVISYVGAGIVCMMTASSAAELATGMPTSGGDYYFVSRSLGPALGAISGVGIWLSLTFAISFYLFGMGEYLTQFLPVTPLWGAFAAGLLLTGINVVGAKESGRMQIIVVVTLFAILIGFSIAGLTRVEDDNFTPFMPFGAESVFSTTALVFISFLGFVKIAAVAEEVKDPSKNLPRTLIGSVALVTCLYVVIVLVIAGMFTQETIGDVRDPLTTAARTLFGSFGAGAIIFAGLLATLSSANASIMAASRINLAMARDRLIPNWLSAIHETMRTPYRALLITGGLALSFLFIESLESLAKIASVLQLYSYAALNVGCVVLRAAAPDWYRPTYRTPGNPFVQLFAAAACISIIFFSGPFAQIAVVVLIVVSLAWFFVWGRSRVDIENAVGDLRMRWAEAGWRSFFQPVPQFAAAEGVEEAPPRSVETAAPRKVMVAVANPETEGDLLHLGRMIATGRTEGGQVVGMHLVPVPLQTPLRAARERFAAERPTVERTIATVGDRDVGAEDGRRPVGETSVSAKTDVAHHIFDGLIAETEAHEADMLLMGWHGGLASARIYESPLQKIIADTKADVAVLRDRGLGRIDKILVPWGGGMHAHLGMETAVRVADATGAAIHVLRVVRPGVDVQRERQAVVKAVGFIVQDYNPVLYYVQPAERVMDGITAHLDKERYDLVIIGASHESRFRNVLFGSIPDKVAAQAGCSVLMTRRYVPEHWSLKASEGIKRIKESVGLTTSPEEDAE